MSMINLMPPKHKQAIGYARKNSLLIRWMIGIMIAAAGIVVVAGGGLFYLKQDSRALQASISETAQQLEKQNEKQTLARVSEISGTLKLAVDVLSGQVVFSDLLQQIGLIMPPRTVLKDLSITDELKGGIDLSVGAADREAAAQVQINLSDKSKGIFEKADINSIDCQAAEDDRYPCTVQVRALFIDGTNPFLLLNKEDKTP